ncbi:MAG: aquaporin [Chitinophagales bacterium]|nr:aquaporin [Chitinophagales bacterium]MDW8418301.1 aquaporin [Chitinophagales bacterium]
MFRKWLSEYLGTFILIFAGTGAVVVNQHTNGALGLSGIALVWGFVIIALIYAFGDISGTHINPAVTVAFAADGRFAWREVPGYILSQLAGALSGSLLLRILFPENTHLGVTLPAGHAWQSFVLETAMTFILMMVILRVSTGAKEKGITAGIAIGGTVLLLVLFGGPISATSLNPTRSLAPALVSGNFNYVWIYLTAPFLGSLLAVSVNKFLAHATEN